MIRNKWNGLLAVAGAIGAAIIVVWMSMAHVLASIRLSIGLALIIGCFLLIYPIWRNRRRFRSLPLVDVDSMCEQEFEHYVANLMNIHGFETTAPPGFNTLGNGIVAKKRGTRTAVYCVPSIVNVSQAALRRAVEYMQRYECSTAMVVTNSYFTKRAVELNRSMGCELIDRTQLAEWIAEFDKSRANHAGVGRP